MEAGKILSADVLDIIFDTRNKEYGAYDLRKNYQRRLTKAVLAMFLVVILLLLTYWVGATMEPTSNQIVRVKEIELENVADKKKQEIPPVVPPPVQEVKEVKTKMFAKFLITPDDKVPENERPPEQTELADSKIGTANIDGKDYDGIEGPPVAAAKGVIDEPKNPDADKEKIWYSVEIESVYPGGVSAWSRFLGKNVQYTDQLVDMGVEGTVMVLFIVDTEGNVSDVSALSGPDELRKIAVDAIKKSGKWEPAIQNGRKVKSYKRQPITFKLPAE